MFTGAARAARTDKPVHISIKLIEEDPIPEGGPLDAKPPSGKIVPKQSSEDKITSMALHHILQDTRPSNYHSHITNSPIEILTSTSSQCLKGEASQEYPGEVPFLKPYKGFYNPFYEAKIANKSSSRSIGPASPERSLHEITNERSRVGISSSSKNINDFDQPAEESVTSSFPNFQTLSDRKLASEPNQTTLALPQKHQQSKIVSQRRHGNLESIVEISQSSRVNADTEENLFSKDHLNLEPPSYEVFEPISPNLLWCIVKEDTIKINTEKKSNSHQKMSQALAGLKVQLGIFNENVKLRKSELNLEERQIYVQSKKRANEAALFQLRQAELGRRRI